MSTDGNALAALDKAALLRWMLAFARLVEENEKLLTDLDAEIGDADHGVNMRRGVQILRSELVKIEPLDFAMSFRHLGQALLGAVGGASGPLYSTFFMQGSSRLAGLVQADAASLAAFFVAGVQGVKTRGRANLGDKTMLDSLHYAAKALHDAACENRALVDGVQAALEAAEEGKKATIPMIARRGRAAFLKERSAGHQDPGATSSTFLVQALVEACKT